MPSKFAATSLMAEAVKLSLSVLYTGFIAYSKILTSSKASASLFLRGLVVVPVDAWVVASPVPVALPSVEPEPSAEPVYKKNA